MRLTPCLRTPHSRLRLLDSPPAMAADHKTGACIQEATLQAACSTWAPAAVRRLLHTLLTSWLIILLSWHSDGQYLCYDSWINNQGQWLLAALIGLFYSCQRKDGAGQEQPPSKCWVKFNQFIECSEQPIARSNIQIPGDTIQPQASKECAFRLLGQPQQGKGRIRLLLHQRQWHVFPHLREAAGRQGGETG